MVPDTSIIDGASSSGSSVVHDQSGDEYKGIVIEPKPGTIVFLLCKNKFLLSYLQNPSSLPMVGSVS